ncbi:MAG: iron-containing alcohol dehydrogenase [Rhodobacteraceae bacterium]|nr:iron-containing alcohol dehydrogenase [Paracoccaceae bacterium]
MTFAILQPPRILFGRGTSTRALAEARAFGARGLIVHGADPARALAVLGTGWDPGMLALSAPREPMLGDLEAALARARAFRPDWVMAIGGGAALDLGKALAALAPATTAPLDHLEGVGQGAPLAAPPLPYLALPTTAGTGSEVTRNAVIGVPGPDGGRKVSLRDDRMIARLAIVDPALTDHCPRDVTLASGLDAITQLVEPFVSLRATPYTDALARPAIGPGLAALMRLMKGETAADRDRLAWVSLCGGLALTNAGLGAVHGLAGVIGGLTGARHGAICGALLGPVLAMNRALASGQARARIDEALGLLAQPLGVAAQEVPAALAAWIRGAGLPGLAAQGLDPRRHAEVAAAALVASSMRANPAAPSPAALCAALAAA